MLPPAPPYALAPTNFRFPALASLAGRAPLGGRREVVLATYVAARLAHDTLAERGVSADARTERATHARTWLATLALPSAARTALQRSIDASAAGPGASADALTSVVAAIDGHLDPHCRLELGQLIKVLSAAAGSS